MPHGMVKIQGGCTQHNILTGELQCRGVCGPIFRNIVGLWRNNVVACVQSRKEDLDNVDFTSGSTAKILFAFNLIASSIN